MATNYWLLADTHFGHDKLEGVYGWPTDFAARTIKAITNVIQPRDVLIHLGDACFYHEAYWHDLIRASCLGKMWLIRGNHDKKSYSWYIDHGWDMVCEELHLDLFGKRLLLSHHPGPQENIGYDLNIHGHLHQQSPRWSHNIKVATELNNWQPLSLRKLVESVSTK